MKPVRPNFWVSLLPALIACLIAAPGVSAQSAPDLDINSAAIVSLAKSLANRFAHLRPHLDTGVIGLTHDGSVALRDSASLDVKVLLVLDVLIAEENKDRATLYREIARANRRPEWESDLRTTFGRRWISRMPAGWFYRNEQGQWVRK
ncbi:MAG: YdbL family protein [Burkholderiales bacterium]|nr:YdbL family protein [Burkholderiales bacterium]